MTTTEAKLSTSKLASDKEYREAFVSSFLKRYIPFQVRTIRKKRGMSQPELAEAAKITQGVISRAEDPDNGNLTFNTVLRIAAGFDLAFVGKFVRFSELLKAIDEMSEDSLDLPGFVKECEIEAAASVKTKSATARALAGSGVLKRLASQQKSGEQPSDDLRNRLQTADYFEALGTNRPMSGMNLKEMANTAIDTMRSESAVVIEYTKLREQSSGTAKSLEQPNPGTLDHPKIESIDTMISRSDERTAHKFRRNRRGRETQRA